uniref:Uncharacterized protein n=1 Tax=Chromera velia CCMP2878 TaxID=1169474 RepID=A0A0G4G6K5_9ALVE|eukprot:Cvel_4256.t1-p1 / transcript=Cvel_4256.t1 / gene=Cvel_4256 / organism=Chromera_velia_CCMP2878 / gene_product=ATP-dependent DNA helicase RecG, putative / transcript_product=ATP-dependent DNA helicase RecG, putative / location=Cvel_scaffold184:53382-61249(+) / protein_length=1302 / sequence_SO=supercontig / SO=protein_coding / is_pseudo=false
MIGLGGLLVSFSFFFCRADALFCSSHTAAPYGLLPLSGVLLLLLLLLGVALPATLSSSGGGGNPMLSSGSFSFFAKTSPVCCITALRPSARGRRKRESAFVRVGAQGGAQWLPRRSPVSVPVSSGLNFHFSSSASSAARVVSSSEDGLVRLFGSPEIQMEGVAQLPRGRGRPRAAVKKTKETAQNKKTKSQPPREEVPGRGSHTPLQGGSQQTNEDEHPQQVVISSLVDLARVPVTALKGISFRRAAALESVGVFSVADLLLFFPRTYVDRQSTSISSLGERVSAASASSPSLVPEGKEEQGDREGEQKAKGAGGRKPKKETEGKVSRLEISVVGEIVSASQFFTRTRQLVTKATVRELNGKSTVDCVWFNQAYRIGQLKKGEKVAVAGKAGRNSKGALSFSCPEVRTLTHEEASACLPPPTSVSPSASSSSSCASVSLTDLSVEGSVARKAASLKAQSLSLGIPDDTLASSSSSSSSGQEEGGGEEETEAEGEGEEGGVTPWTLQGWRHSRILPVYPSVPGLPSAVLLRAVWDALEMAGCVGGQGEGEEEAKGGDGSVWVRDVVPPSLIAKRGLLSRTEALREMHRPSSEEKISVGRKRLFYDTVLRMQFAMALQQHRVERLRPGTSLKEPRKPHRYHDLVARFVRLLPFELTDGQKNALEEIKKDMGKEKPMRRLVQGDVASGKTVVAQMASLVAVSAGKQVAFMAPTEHLARQHFVQMKRLMGDELGVCVRLLTGEMSVKEQEETVQEVREGECEIVVGTHSLFQDRVAFKDLGLVVVDEQQRFGVRQRWALQSKATSSFSASADSSTNSTKTSSVSDSSSGNRKGEGHFPPGVEGGGRWADLLLLSATPIPRTLMLTLYGDLKVSSIRQMPKGRRVVRTRALCTDRRDSVRELRETVRAEAQAGRGTFWVCPLVDESDLIQAQSATETHSRLMRTFPDLRIGLLHGQMLGSEKMAVLESFRNRTLDLLVATTVIEVGLDVPQASLVVVEDAHRYGLCQLHQLRGRVGRAAESAPHAQCFLLYSLKRKKKNKRKPQTAAKKAKGKGENPSPHSEREDAAANAGPRALHRFSVLEETHCGFALAEIDLDLRGYGTMFGSQQSGESDLRPPPGTTLEEEKSLWGVAAVDAQEMLEALSLQAASPSPSSSSRVSAAASREKAGGSPSPFRLTEEDSKTKTEAVRREELLGVGVLPPSPFPSLSLDGDPQRDRQGSRGARRKKGVTDSTDAPLLLKKKDIGMQDRSVAGQEEIEGGGEGSKGSEGRDKETQQGKETQHAEVLELLREAEALLGAHKVEWLMRT